MPQHRALPCLCAALLLGFGRVVRLHCGDDNLLNLAFLLLAGRSEEEREENGEGQRGGNFPYIGTHRKYIRKVERFALSQAW